MARCAGITKGGARCTLDALAGAEWCYGHDPQRAGERSRNASRAGKTGGRGRPGQPEIADIRSGLYSVISGVLDGSVERGRGAVAVQGYGCLLRAVEVERKVKETDELLERISALEDAQASPAQNGGRVPWRG